MLTKLIKINRILNNNTKNSNTDINHNNEYSSQISKVKTNNYSTNDNNYRNQVPPYRNRSGIGSTATNNNINYAINYHSGNHNRSASHLPAPPIKITPNQQASKAA